MDEIITQNNVQPPKKKHTTLIYYGVLTLIVAIGIIIWFFNFRIDESALRDIEKKIRNDDKINSYFTDVFIFEDSESEPVKSETLTSYGYLLNLNGNEKFTKLSDEEKLEQIGFVSERLDIYTENNTMVNCGRNKYCSINKISYNGVSEGIDNYSVNYEPLSKAEDYTMTVHKSDLNDEDYTDFENYTVSLEEEEDNKLTEQQLQDQIDKNTENPGTVRIGMTKEEVLTEGWGRPIDINRTTTAYGTNEQWVYDNYNYLYFEDGILKSFQN